MAQLIAQLPDAAACAAVLGTRSTRRLGHNTTLRREGDAFRVKYHETDILTYTPDGAVQFNAGGRLTVTTRQRFNSLAPCRARVWQAGGVWYAQAPEDAAPVIYRDGLTRTPAGTWENTGESPAPLRRMIRDYARAYAQELAAGRIPLPSAGDCFFCQFNWTHGADSVQSHCEERYFVPSLLFGALRRAGCGPALLYAAQEAMTAGAGLGPRSFLRPADVARYLRRHLYAEAGLAR